MSTEYIVIEIRDLTTIPDVEITNLLAPINIEISQVGAQGPAVPNTFETVSMNLAQHPYVLAYTLLKLTSVTYTLPGSRTIVKTLNYTGDKLTSIVLSGDTPDSINLTKTLTYTVDSLTGIAYS